MQVKYEGRVRTNTARTTYLPRANKVQKKPLKPNALGANKISFMADHPSNQASKPIIFGGTKGYVYSNWLRTCRKFKIPSLRAVPTNSPRNSWLPP